MAKLVTLLEQCLDRQPPTVAILATTWWEAGLALVKLQDCGLEVHLPVTLHACTHSAGKYLVLSICYTGAAEQVNSWGGGGRGEHAKHAPLGHALP